MRPVISRPRSATRLAGAALLLSGLAFNPLALAHLFPAHPLGIEDIIVLQIALLFGGGWLVWCCPRLPLIPIVLVALTFGTFAILGGYGTVRSLQRVQERNRLLATIDRSEAVQQHLSGEALPLLALGMYQGELPAAPARALFADTVDVADVGQTAEATEVVPALGIKRQHWRILPAEQFHGSDIQLWESLLAAVRFFDYAAFHIETGHFLDAGETIYQARLRFDASAQTQDGERAQVRAWLVIDWQQGEDASWRIRRWETESLEMLTRAHALFAEVLDEVLPHDEDRTRARFSRHAALVRQSFSDSAFVAPHRHFTRQAFDRHPGISVVDIDADGYDDLYIAVRQGRNMLLHNGGDGTFDERAAQYGLDVEHHTAAALFADFDNDGDPDVFLGRTLAPSRYLVNEDGHFVSCDLGDGVLPFLVASISAADYDNDGLLDVYFSTYAARMLLEAVYRRVWSRGAINRLLAYGPRSCALRPEPRPHRSPHPRRARAAQRPAAEPWRRPLRANRCRVAQYLTGDLGRLRPRRRPGSLPRQRLCRQQLAPQRRRCPRRCHRGERGCGSGLWHGRELGRLRRGWPPRLVCDQHAQQRRSPHHGSRWLCICAVGPG